MNVDRMATGCKINNYNKKEEAVTGKLKEKLCGEGPSKIYSEKRSRQPRRGGSTQKAQWAPMLGRDDLGCVQRGEESTSSESGDNKKSKEKKKKKVGKKRKEEEE